MAPDMGTNEQVMAWFMDTYSVHQGYAVSEIVTGKPVDLGGTVGRREATGRGIAYLVGRALDAIGLKAQGATAIVPVSYTHLDVYKRQVFSSARPRCTMRRS